jgi:hypothetical protein
VEHEQNWVKAIKQEATASSPLEYAAQLTETMLLASPRSARVRDARFFMMVKRCSSPTRRMRISF